MGIIKKGVLFSTKLAGSAIVGTVGVISAAVASAGGHVTPEMKNVCNGIKDDCFSMVKGMWGINNSGETNSRKMYFASKEYKRDLIAAMNSMNNLKKQKRKDVVNNPSLLRKVLEDKGMNPDLADNPEFVNYLKKQWGL